MRFTQQLEGGTGTLRLEGRFTFECHPGFKASTRAMLSTQGLTRLVLDMEAVTFMDASSLGMVLLLRESAGERAVSIILQRPSHTVRNLLKIVQFEKLFEILP